jgi:hypothetical protein
VDLSARYQSLGTHQLLDPATDLEQNIASQVDKFGTHKEIGSAVESLAMTSRIHHLQPGIITANNSGETQGGPIVKTIHHFIPTNNPRTWRSALKSSDYHIKTCIGKPLWTV